MLRPGETLGSYEIIAAIAGGGMGVVYRGRHLVLGRDAAIKVLLPNLAMKESVRHRFRQEAYVQAQLQWPGIVSMQDFIQRDDLLAMVMEYVDGPTLEHVLGTEHPGPWEPHEVVRVMTPILAAMAYAHQRRVVHRDLKPANVMLDRVGGPPWPGIPKITDFGLAKLLEDESGMTVLGSRMGTIPYMAPEQYAGKKGITAAADVYALGVFLYRMLTGELPFEPDDMLTATRIYSGAQPVPSVLERAPETPRELVSVVEAALAPRATDRFPDAAALASALGIQLHLSNSSLGGSQPPNGHSQPPSWGSQPPSGYSPPPRGSSPPPSAPPHDQSAATPSQATRPTPQSSAPSGLDEQDTPVPTRRGLGLPVAAAAGGLVLLLALGGVLIAVVGAGIAQKRAADEEARRIAAAQESREIAAKVGDSLELYKVDHQANKDEQLLSRARSDARRAMELARTPEAVSMAALTEVWAHKWHYGSAEWNESYYRDDDALTLEAMEHPTPEGALARALLVSNACRIASERDKRRDALCGQVATVYEKAHKMLANDPRAWLRFEATWTEAAFYRRMADQLDASGQESQATSYRRRVEEICERGKPDLQAAPVNDIYFAEHCLIAAARRDDFESYFWWIRWVWGDDIRKNGKDYGFTVNRAFSSPRLDCAGDKDFIRSIASARPNPRNGPEHLCAAAGYLALGCSSDGRAALGQAARAGVDRDSLVALERASSPAGRACYYR